MSATFPDTMTSQLQCSYYSIYSWVLPASDHGTSLFLHCRPQNDAWREKKKNKKVLHSVCGTVFLALSCKLHLLVSSVEVQADSHPPQCCFHHSKFTAHVLISLRVDPCGNIFTDQIPLLQTMFLKWDEQSFCLVKRFICPDQVEMLIC